MDPDAAFDAHLTEGGVRFTERDADLLRAIREAGSLNGAADALERSYSRSQQRVVELEDAFGELVERQRGGSGGGGSSLTETAEALLAEFERVEAEFSGVAEVAETVLAGTVVEREGELGTVETEAGLVRALVPAGAERVCLAVRADAITLHAPESVPESETSARNRFAGEGHERVPVVAGPLCRLRAVRPPGRGERGLVPEDFERPQRYPRGAVRAVLADRLHAGPDPVVGGPQPRHRLAAQYLGRVDPRRRRRLLVDPHVAGRAVEQERVDDPPGPAVGVLDGKRCSPTDKRDRVAEPGLLLDLRPRGGLRVPVAARVVGDVARDAAPPARVRPDGVAPAQQQHLALAAQETGDDGAFVHANADGPAGQEGAVRGDRTGATARRADGPRRRPC